MKVKLAELDDVEVNLIEDFRSLTPECRNNVLLVMTAAVQASGVTGTLLDLIPLLAASN